MSEPIPAGSTDQTIDVFLQDSSSTTGAGLTGLLYNTSGLTCYYRKGATGSSTQLTLATQTVGGAHSDGGFVEIDSTNQPGMYRLDLSDTIVASEGYVTIYLQGAANLLATPIRVDVVSATRGLAGTALPAAAADAAGGLVISDAGGLDIDNRLISATATAALEDQFDGTGLTGDTYPATQAQVGNIAIAGAAINTVAESYTLTTGTQSSGTISDTNTLDGTTHQHTDSAGAMELYYQFDLGADGVPTSTKFVGRLNGANDSLGVFAYNWAGTSWDQIGTLSGTNGATNETNTYDLLAAHVGTGSNAGKVRIRYYAASGLTSATLYVDQILVSYTQLATGIPNGSTITLSDDTSNTNLVGYGWNLALGGQDISGAYIYQSVNVSGTATGANGSPFTFQESFLATVSLDAYGFLENCAIGGTLTLTNTAGVTADSISLFGCWSGVAGSGSPTITASGVTKTTNIQTRGWHGGLTGIMNSFCVWSHEVAEGGTQTFTNDGGQLELRGNPKAVNLTTSGSATNNIVIGNGAPITIAGTGGTVNIYGQIGVIDNNSTGVTVNLFSNQKIAAGVASGTPTTTTFSVAETLTADQYNDCILMFTDGAAANQPRSILGNTTSAITVSEVFTTAPAAGDNYAIYRDHIHPVSQIQNGLATSSALTSLQTDVTTLLGRVTATLFSGITSLAEWLGLLAGKQTPDATALTEIRASGAGSGTYDATTDSLEAVRDNQSDGGGGLTQDDIDSIVAGVTAVGDQVQQANDNIILTYRGAVWSQQLTGLTTLTGQTDIVFCLKRDAEDTDANAVLKVSASVGLEVLKGSTSVTAGDASIVVDQETPTGEVTLTVADSVMAQVFDGTYVDAWKMLNPSGDTYIRVGKTIVRPGGVDETT